LANDFVRSLRNAVLFGSVPAQAHITFLGRCRLFVDPSDNRGKSVLRSSGVTQPRVSLAWRGLAKRIRPDVVLDIGANYGEISLSLKYSEQSKVHLFEPNPHVRRYLDRSVSTHVNRQNIIVHSEVMSDRAGSVEFVIDRKWSGTSSVVGEIEDSGFKGGGEQSYERLNLSTSTIDQCVEAVSDRHLLFKIDVEGYERQVMLGMERTLRRSAAFGGIVEFDRLSLQRANTDPDAFVAHLKTLGIVHVLSGGTLSDMKVPPVHCDLVIVSDERYLDGLMRLPNILRTMSPRWLSGVFGGKS
jgi:FkbM family methyltransferase